MSRTCRSTSVCTAHLTNPSDDPAVRGGPSVSLVGDDGVRYHTSHLRDVLTTIALNRDGLVSPIPRRTARHESPPSAVVTN